MRKLPLLLFLSAWAFCCREQPRHALVLQTDFGVKDGAVAAMKGVALSISPDLQIFDLTHEIPAFNVWEAAYRLQQTAEFWPTGTVFVSVVDPGVGTDRTSVVLKTTSGHFFVTPDNGTLTLVAANQGIAEIREIDETRHRLPGSEQSHTFHGRDVYAVTGARLAAGAISFEQVGPELPLAIVTIPYQKARFENGVLYGNIPILDVQYGNVWTNIGRNAFDQLDCAKGEMLRVKITRAGEPIFEQQLPFADTFGAVPPGKPLLYFNSLNNLSLAVNQGDFAGTHGIGSGPEWNIELRK